MALLTLEIILLISASILFFYYYLTRIFDFWKSQGVKGPKPIPFFGSMRDVITTKLSVGCYLQNIYNEYKDERIIGIFEGHTPALVLRDPDLIKDVLIKDFSVFSNRPILYHEKNEPLSQHIVGLPSSKWRPLRTKLSPIFTAVKLKNMFNSIIECTEKLKSLLETTIKKGEPIDIRDISMRFAIDVISSSAFGINVEAMAAEHNEFRRMSQRMLRNDLKTYLKLRISKMPRLYNIIGRFFCDKDVEEFFIRFAMETLEYRKRNNIRRDDITNVLVDINDRKKLDDFDVNEGFLASNIAILFAAGYETISSTISNAMYELALNHTTQDKLRREIKKVLELTNGKITFECMKEMKYLEALILETLRKYPPLPYLLRGALKNYTFRDIDVTIPKKTKVYIPLYGIHNDPDIYPKPEVFDPERFMEENAKSRHPMFFLPFGDGPRNCIGSRLANHILKIAIINIVINYLVDVCEKTPLPPYPLNMKDELLLIPACQIYLKLSPISNLS